MTDIENEGAKFVIRLQLRKRGTQGQVTEIPGSPLSRERRDENERAGFRNSITPSKAGIQGHQAPCLPPWAPASALGHAHMFGWYRSNREPLPLSARLRGEREGPGVVRREGEVGSSAVRDGGSPHLTPTLSAPKGGEGDIPAACLAVRSVHALALPRGRQEK